MRGASTRHFAEPIVDRGGGNAGWVGPHGNRARSGTRCADHDTQPFVDALNLLGDAAALTRLAAANGYLFFRGLAPRDVIVRLRAEVLAQCARRGWLDDASTRSRAIATADAGRRATSDHLLWFQSDVQSLPVFGELRSAPAIASALGAVFGASPLGVWRCRTLRVSEDLERTTAPHQDHFYTRRSESLWTVWMPLLDCPSTLGGLAVLPGSHLGGLRPHDGGEGFDRFIVLPETTPWASTGYRAGDVLCFNALTVHMPTPI